MICSGAAHGERSPHVEYHLTVNYMINAQESRGEGWGPLYSEQVAVRAKAKMTSSCGSVLLPTHTCTHTLSPKIPSLTWLSVRLFRLFKMLSHFLSIQQIAELYRTDGLNCDAVVPWHKVKYLFTVTREVKAVCKREVTASVWTQCNINPTKSELSFRFYLLSFYIIFMFFIKKEKIFIGNEIIKQPNHQNKVHICKTMDEFKFNVSVCCYLTFV